MEKFKRSLIQWTSKKRDETNQDLANRGIITPDRKVAFCWQGNIKSRGVFNSLDEFVKIHGANYDICINEQSYNDWEDLDFHLQRDEDVTGISGTGIVAEGFLCNNGVIILVWGNSITFYDNIQEVEKIHCHDGATKIVWHDIGNALPLDKDRIDEIVATYPQIRKVY